MISGMLLALAVHMLGVRFGLDLGMLIQIAFHHGALAAFQTAREAPRVPFAALIERGMIAPGDKLTDAKRRVKALVRADGAVALGDAVGSIHRIGALAQGLEACNGWTYWHVERKGGLTLIDSFRSEIRAAMSVAAE